MKDVCIKGFRLSPQQERLWTLGVNGPSFYSQCSLSLTGELNFTKLEHAVQQVVQKHEALRTTFKQLQGMELPLQIVHEEMVPEWKQVDLQVEAETDNTEKIQVLYEKEQLKPFDLENGPLFRLTLISLTEQHNILLMTISALCADTVSLHNLVAEIQEAYMSPVDFEEEEPLQYIQFSEWKNDIYEEDEEGGIAFWENQEWEPAMQLKLPWNDLSELSPKVPNIESIMLSSDLSIQFEEVAEKWELSLEDLLFASWHLFMWHLTGQSEITTGYVFDGRKYEEMEKTIGLLAGTAPVRYTYIANTRMDEVLQELAEAQYNAYEWQEYFSYGLVQSNDIYFSSGFEYSEAAGMLSSESPHFELEKLTSLVDYFDLKMSCTKLGESLSLDIYYTNPYWEEEYVRELLQSYIQLVKYAVEQPETLITDLDILSKEMKQHLLTGSATNPASSPFASECFHILFEQQVERTPDEIAVIFEEQQLTYRELNERANQLAHALVQQGVEAEVKVGICMERSLDMIVALLGVLKAGGAYVPIDPALPAERKQFILQDADISIYLTQKALMSDLPAIEKNVICLDSDGDKLSTESKDNPNRSVTIDNAAYTIYTSGSTGKPKGVVVEHGQLLNYLNGMYDRFEIGSAASYATVSTLAADLGNTVIYTSLCTGGRLHIISQERLLDPKQLADYCENHTIDCLKIVPSHLSTLLSAPQSANLLPKRLLVLGGEALSWDLVSRIQELAPDCRIINHYGPTEATIGVTTYGLHERKEKTVAATVPIGKPIANTKVYIMNSQCQLVPIGAAGELYIGGESVTRGYLNHPELTADRFIENPFDNEQTLYRTGDIVRYLPDGNLEFIGRVDDQVKIRGYRVELGEIQHALEQHPSIKEALVLARDEHGGDKYLVAYLLASSSEVPSQEELSERLQSILPEYFVPSAFVFLNKFPLTANGKINRQALPDPASQSARPIIAPETPTQEWVAEIWYKVLGTAEISIHDKFFEIGGNSLKSVNALALLQEKYPHIKLVDLFEHNTIASLSEFIDKQEGQGEAEENEIENFEL
ncbi:non-ribosomal peptide synthetase [Bacillus fungorum]|uniref:Non-ribosomal peptide synthetase n=1 Tax=Bacillus fungorum TaxID=2039284 RepID=A0A2G6Q876_9BACI|nr:non-ribosomal peptide synthetase [Bacillus fungorum]PIE93033.1 non-ribosomal peptide synthetase [Bacillus fungorum]